MPISSDLISSIQASLGNSIAPSLTTASATWDLYEAYIFSLILEAARSEGANVNYVNRDGSTPTVFTFRTSPGRIWSPLPYTYAVLEFQGKPTLEAHIGIYASGKSKVTHECDVAVLLQTEAETCRQGRGHPRSSKVVIAIECKYYSTNLSLGQARGFIGLASDLAAQNCMFIVNTSPDSAEMLLTKRGKDWETSVIPNSPRKEQQVRSFFCRCFRDFKATR